MRRTATIAFLCLCLASPGASGFAPSACAAQSSPPQVVDRIVAHIEDDIIMQSEVRELSAYQELVDSQAESDDRVLNELIEQWVVNNEATATQFPAAAEAEVNREVARIQGRFPSPQAYSERLTVVGLAPAAVKRLVAREIYLARYLDYKFRPAVQVGDEDIAKYYKEQLVPTLEGKGQSAPPLDQVTEQIRELLVQQGVSERATTWFDETKSRLKIQIEPATAASSKTTP